MYIYVCVFSSRCAYTARLSQTECDNVMRIARPDLRRSRVASGLEIEVRKTCVCNVSECVNVRVCGRMCVSVSLCVHVRNANTIRILTCDAVLVCACVCFCVPFSAVYAVRRHAFDRAEHLMAPSSLDGKRRTEQ